MCGNWLWWMVCGMWCVGGRSGDVSVEGLEFTWPAGSLNWDNQQEARYWDGELCELSCNEYCASLNTQIQSLAMGESYLSRCCSLMEAQHHYVAVNPRTSNTTEHHVCRRNTSSKNQHPHSRRCRCRCRGGSTIIIHHQLPAIRTSLSNHFLAFTVVADSGKSWRQTETKARHHVY